MVKGPFSGTPAAASGKVYAIMNGAVNEYTTNGAYMKSFIGPSGGSFSGQLIVTDDVLLAVGSYGVYVFKLSDATIQQEITSFRTSCYCYYGSTISLANNTLYITSGDSNLYAYSAEPLLKLGIENSGPAKQVSAGGPHLLCSLRT